MPNLRSRPPTAPLNLLEKQMATISRHSRFGQHACAFLPAVIEPSGRGRYKRCT